MSFTHSFASFHKVDSLSIQNRPQSGFTQSSMASSIFIYGTGQDFDMTEFEVLRFDVKSLPSQSTSETGSTSVSPSLTPESSPPPTPTLPPSSSAPEKPEEVGNESNSPQLRLMRKKAPEVLAASTWLLSCCLILTVPRWRLTYPITNLNCCGSKRIIATQHICNCGESGHKCALMKMTKALIIALFDRPLVHGSISKHHIALGDASHSSILIITLMSDALQGHICGILLGINGCSFIRI